MSRRISRSRIGLRSCGVLRMFQEQRGSYLGLLLQLKHAGENILAREGAPSRVPWLCGCHNEQAQGRMLNEGLVVGEVVRFLERVCKSMTSLNEWTTPGTFGVSVSQGVMKVAHEFHEGLVELDVGGENSVN